MSIDKEFLSKVIVEPLDSKHDRAAFSCGEVRIDNYLKYSALNHSGKDFVKVYVAIERDSEVVLGYYALGPHAIDISSLPDEAAKKMPKWPLIPSIYVSMVGVDNSCQGKGLGTLLVADAFKRSVRVADMIGGHFIVLDALNEKAARLYRRLGFVELPSQEGRMIMGIKQVRKAIGAA